MRARLITSQGPAGDLPTNTVEYASTDPFGAMKKAAGFKAGYILVDRNTGKRVGLMLWESAEALAQTSGVGDDARARALARTGATLISIEDFDVITVAVSEKEK